MSQTRIDTPAAAEPGLGDYIALLKPRVMSLAVFTALVGLMLAPTPLPVMEGVAAIIFIAVGAGAAGALNMWWDGDIDRSMRRTRARAVPQGRVAPGEALGFGIALAGLSVVMLGLATNAVAAGLLAATIAFYVLVYSMWLKRATPQNIVIGGAAGALPPVIGWAAATGGVSPASAMMFLLIFAWTPPHFWALALFVRDDYSNAGVPMLTVTHGRRATRRHILGYTIALVAVAAGLAVTSVAGPVYMATALVVNALFLRDAVAIQRRDETAAEADGYRAEKRFFRFSLYYVFLHFTALLADAALINLGFGV